MRAVVQKSYGEPARVLELRDDLDEPGLADNTVLVRVHASSVNAGDWRAVRARPIFIRFSTGLLSPKAEAVGVDVAGVVRAVGNNVSHLAVGDEVYGMRSGAFAEYVSGRNFVRKPGTMSFREAAAVPAAGCTALQAVRDRGEVAPGQRVLVNGAGGGVGVFAVQLAKAFGAEVTAVTRTECVQLVGSLGADEVIDYTREDFTHRKERYDVVVDCGGKPSIRAFRRVLTSSGKLVLVAAGKGPFGVIGRLVGSQLRRRVLGQPVINFIASGPFNENLETLRELIEAGKVRSVIDRTYSLEHVAQAVGYIETESACGKIVITIAGDG